MYTGQASQNLEPKTQVTERRLLQLLVERFSNINDTQDGLINCIEDKLHNILNKRIPVSESKTEQLSINDFATMADSQLTRGSYHNNRLEAILQHLNEII